MSEDNAEQDPNDGHTSADSGDEGVDGLQEQHLDSVTGGGNIRQPVADMQAQDYDTIKHSQDQEQVELEDGGDPDRAANDD